MNPYANPTVNYTVNKENPYTQDELAAMQLAAMQEYMEKEKAYEEASQQGYGDWPYFAGALGGTALGGVGGYKLGGMAGRGLARLLKATPDNVGASGAVGKFLGGLVGSGAGFAGGMRGVSALEDYQYPGVRQEKRRAMDEFHDAQQYLEDTGDMDPQMYESLRLKERIRVPRHYKLDEEKAYNEMLAREKQNQITLQNQQIIDNMFRTAAFAERISMMEKVAQDLVEADTGMTAQQEAEYLQALQEYENDIGENMPAGAGIVPFAAGAAGALGGGALGYKYGPALAAKLMKKPLDHWGRYTTSGVGSTLGASALGAAGYGGAQLAYNQMYPEAAEQRRLAQQRFSDAESRILNQ